MSKTPSSASRDPSIASSSTDLYLIDPAEEIAKLTGSLRFLRGLLTQALEELREKNERDDPVARLTQAKRSDQVMCARFSTSFDFLRKYNITFGMYVVGRETPRKTFTVTCKVLVELSENGQLFPVLQVEEAPATADVNLTLMRYKGDGRACVPELARFHDTFLNGNMFFLEATALGPQLDPEITQPCPILRRKPRNPDLIATNEQNDFIPELDDDEPTSRSKNIHGYPIIVRSLKSHQPSQSALKVDDAIDVDATEGIELEVDRTEDEAATNTRVTRNLFPPINRVNVD